MGKCKFKYCWAPLLLLVSKTKFDFPVSGQGPGRDLDEIKLTSQVGGNRKIEKVPDGKCFPPLQSKAIPHSHSGHTEGSDPVSRCNLSWDSNRTVAHRLQRD